MNWSFLLEGLDLVSFIDWCGSRSHSCLFHQWCISPFGSLGSFAAHELWFSEDVCLCVKCLF